ncbi:MAG TPA: hypothetical protein VN428_00455 [Bryobacteraceae bacterium]|nr:hypothetical protein [Bryobacteraceae bacterium]
MSHRAFIAAAALAVLASCAREPERFPPPPQRSLGVGAFVEMKDPDAGEYIVSGTRDFSEGAGWRWTHQRPELRFKLRRTEGWRFSLDLGLPAPNMEQTGPVTITFFINGRRLDRVRYPKPGDFHFEKAVPPEWLKSGELNVFAAYVEPSWVSPDGEKLGFVLQRAGFVSQ